MNMRQHGLIPYIHPALRPAVVRESRLPALLERKLHLSEPQRIQPPRRAIYEEGSTDSPNATKSLEQATKDLVVYFDANKSEIKFGLSVIRSTDIMKEVQCDFAGMLQHLFQFFDEYVFMGKLKGRVQFVGLRPSARPALGVNDAGKTIVQKNGDFGVLVILNVHSLVHLFTIRETFEAQDHIISALAHQLIHAYFLLACGAQDTSKKANELLSHGEHFGVIMHKIKNAAPELPIDFSNTMPEVNRSLRDRTPFSDTGGIKLRSRLWADDRKISTECTRSVKSLKEEECEDWYKGKCLKVLDPDVYVFDEKTRSFCEKSFSKCGDKSDWVEIIHKKKPYKVTRKAIDIYPSLKKKFEDSNRKLDISNDHKKEAFEEFICYVCEGEDYTAHHLSLKTCVELYHLAASIKFDDLKDDMLDLMYGEALRDFYQSDDNILEVIRAVYGRQADQNLRGWSRFFMKQVSTTVMRINPDPRLDRLRTNSAALLQDTNRVLREIGPSDMALINGAHATVRPTLGPTTYQMPALTRTISPSGAYSSFTINPAPTVVQNPPIQVTTSATQTSGAMPYVPDQYVPVQYPPAPITPCVYEDVTPGLVWDELDDQGVIWERSRQVRPPRVPLYEYGFLGRR